MPDMTAEEVIAQDDRVWDMCSDEIACRIFDEVFNPTDGCYDMTRDTQRFRDCVAKLIACGYSESDAREFMNVTMSYCDE